MSSPILNSDKIMQLRRANTLLSQRGMAEKVGINRQTMNLIEKGKVDPLFSTVAKLMLAMEVYDIREVI